MNTPERKFMPAPGPSGIVWICVAFWVFGLLMGAGLSVIALSRYVAKPESESPNALAAELAHWLAREHGLGPGETRKAEGILQAHAEELAEVKRQAERDMARRIVAMREEISGVLGPEKAEAWKEHVNRSCHRWMRQEHDGESEGHGPAGRNHHERRPSASPSP